jgi:molecular chaperone GrpE
MPDSSTTTHIEEQPPKEKEKEEALSSGSASAAKEDLESLRNRAVLAERQRDEYLAQLQRARADFENYQKRAQRDQADEKRYANASLARELLPVLDNLQRAVLSARKQVEIGPLLQGVAMVESQLLGALDRFGITPITAQDRPFDPNLHEGVQHSPRSDVEPGTVVEVLEPGYRLHERVLRPAKVAVAAPFIP